MTVKELNERPLNKAALKWLPAEWKPDPNEAQYVLALLQWALEQASLEYRLNLRSFLENGLHMLLNQKDQEKALNYLLNSTESLPPDEVSLNESLLSERLSNAQNREQAAKLLVDQLDQSMSADRSLWDRHPANVSAKQPLPSVSE